MKRYSFIAALICLLLGVGVSALAMVTSYYGWLIELERLSHFQAQYFMVAIALTIIILCLKQSRLALAMTLLCVLLSVQLISWYSLPLSSSSPATNYKVLSANVWVSNTDAQRILAFVMKEQPDLALFMEVNDVMGEQLASALKTILPYSSNQLTPYRLGTVLYSKNPLTDVQLQQFNTRSAAHMSARVEINGKPMSVVGIHPFPPVRPSMFADRNQAFAAVSDYVKLQSDPVILVGDFNASMWSPYYRQLVHQTGLKNSRAGFGLLPTWPSSLSYVKLPQLNALTRLVQIPIDHCLASSSLKVVGMHTGPDIGSDHLPIVVDFQLDNSAT
ncbi:MAG: hypothetical protein DCF25_18450 [Leptolyngbya foveolarum]|uniref:Endonuclease/exonuclease/phosphatase domain-containing protein n=1 Tax=Leptolyngbya foveolarum TaxID=47253 RepID=A0A2W4VIG5_9CYAN|nr:MAG: hypothetical protein DCF25_18450 [Leptolyngbya foveolarum]